MYFLSIFNLRKWDFSDCAVPHSFPTINFLAFSANFNQIWRGSMTLKGNCVVIGFWKIGCGREERTPYLFYHSRKTSRGSLWSILFGICITAIHLTHAQLQNIGMVCILWEVYVNFVTVFQHWHPTSFQFYCCHTRLADRKNKSDHLPRTEAMQSYSIILMLS